MAKRKFTGTYRDPSFFSILQTGLEEKEEEELEISVGRARKKFLTRPRANKSFPKSKLTRGARKGSARESRRTKYFSSPSYRQRCTVKVSYHLRSVHQSRSTSPLWKHLKYLARFENREETKREWGENEEIFSPEHGLFFGPEEEGFHSIKLHSNEVQRFHEEASLEPRHFRLIISPENGIELRDHVQFVRDVMNRLQDVLAKGRLQWLAVVHTNTDNPHTHVVLRGRTKSQIELRLNRDLIRYGIRNIAEDILTRELGFRSQKSFLNTLAKNVTKLTYTELDRMLVSSCKKETKGTAAKAATIYADWGSPLGILRTKRLLFLAEIGLVKKDLTGTTFSFNSELRHSLLKLCAEEKIRRKIHALTGKKESAHFVQNRLFSDEPFATLGIVKDVGFLQGFGPYVILENREHTFEIIPRPKGLKERIFLGSFYKVERKVVSSQRAIDRYLSAFFVSMGKKPLTESSLREFFESDKSTLFLQTRFSNELKETLIKRALARAEFLSYAGILKCAKSGVEYKCEGDFSSRIKKTSQKFITDYQPLCYRRNILTLTEARGENILDRLLVLEGVPKNILNQASTSAKNSHKQMFAETLQEAMGRRAYHLLNKGGEYLGFTEKNGTVFLNEEALTALEREYFSKKLQERLLKRYSAALKKPLHKFEIAPKEILSGTMLGEHRMNGVEKYLLIASNDKKTLFVVPKTSALHSIEQGFVGNFFYKKATIRRDGVRHLVNFEKVVKKRSHERERERS